MGRTEDPKTDPEREERNMEKARKTQEQKAGQGHDNQGTRTEMGTEYNGMGLELSGHGMGERADTTDPQIAEASTDHQGQRAARKRHGQKRH